MILQQKPPNNVFPPAVTGGGYSQKEGAYYFQTIGSTVGWPQEIPINDFMNSFEIYAVAAETEKDFQGSNSADWLVTRRPQGDNTAGLS